MYIYIYVYIYIYIYILSYSFEGGMRDTNQKFNGIDGEHHAVR